jgi:hypothetical protein
VIRLIRPATEVVERIYDVDLPAQPWLESIRRAAERSFTGHIGVQAYMFRVSNEGSFTHEESRVSQKWKPRFAAPISSPPPR